MGGRSSRPTRGIRRCTGRIMRIRDTTRWGWGGSLRRIPRQAVIHLIRAVGTSTHTLAATPSTFTTLVEPSVILAAPPHYHNRGLFARKIPVIHFAPDGHPFRR